MRQLLLQAYYYFKIIISSFFSKPIASYQQIRISCQATSSLGANIFFLVKIRQTAKSVIIIRSHEHYMRIFMILWLFFSKAFTECLNYIRRTLFPDKVSSIPYNRFYDLCWTNRPNSAKKVCIVALRVHITGGVNLINIRNNKNNNKKSERKINLNLLISTAICFLFFVLASALLPQTLFVRFYRYTSIKAVNKSSHSH